MKNKSIDILVVMIIGWLLFLPVSGNVRCADLNNPITDTLPVSRFRLAGNVKNRQGRSLQDVKVGVGNVIVTSTDSAGAFDLLIEDKPTILTFSLDRMVSIKRSYHPAMQEKVFNVIMEKDSCKYCARISAAIRHKN